MKQCIKCGATKQISEFQTRKEGRISGDCRECHRIYMREHYINNIAVYKNKAKKHRIHAKTKTQDFIWEYLGSHPCVDCGESNPIVLDFDHTDPKHKITEVTKIYFAKDITKLVTEISKCKVRCANCHRIRTAKQFSNWKYARLYPLATNELKG